MYLLRQSTFSEIKLKLSLQLKRVNFTWGQYTFESTDLLLCTENQSDTLYHKYQANLAL